MSPFISRVVNLGIAGSLSLAVAILPTAAAATTFRLTGSDVTIDQPAPLFTSDHVTGTLSLADSVKPGDSFGSAAITGRKPPTRVRLRRWVRRSHAPIAMKPSAARRCRGC